VSLLPLFLNQDSLNLPIKTRGQTPLHHRKEMDYCHEMSDRIFDIGANA
jgi:hypothetical protein